MAQRLCSTLLLVCLVSNMAFAQILSRPEADNQDPVRCFDHVWRDARNAVQAYQIVYAQGWKEEVACHGKVPAPDLEPCWAPVIQARPLIEQAAQLYEQARRTTAPQQGQLVAQGNAHMRQAASLLDQAGQCFLPIFSRWQQNGSRYVAGGPGNANAGTGGDVFSSNSGIGQGPPGEPRIDQFGVDTECGGTDRRYYDAMYGTKAVVMSVQQMNQLYAQGRIIRCGACRQNVICWLRPGVAQSNPTPPRGPQTSPGPPPTQPAPAPSNPDQPPNQGKKYVYGQPDPALVFADGFSRGLAECFERHLAQDLITAPLSRVKQLERFGKAIQFVGTAGTIAAVIQDLRTLNPQATDYELGEQAARIVCDGKDLRNVIAHAAPTGPQRPAAPVEGPTPPVNKPNPVRPPATSKKMPDPEARLPIPPTPGGMSVTKFGSDIMKWGTGNDAARARMATLTRQELERAGVTKQIAESWRDFYRNEMVRNPQNPSAPGRADLMQRAVDLLSGGV